MTCDCKLAIPDGTAVTAVPDTGYHFVEWSDSVATATRTDTNVTADISVTASFAINEYTLTYTAGANGTISGTSPQTVNHGSDGTAVTAVPDTGYHFVEWSDSVATATRTDTNVTADISVTASFAINEYTLTYTAGTGGTISGTTPQTVNHGSDGSAVTAVPDTGYHFVEWSDSVATATRTDTNVTADISVTASFAPTMPSTPTLYPEPNCTSGLCNTIYWTPVVDAQDYYVECASDPCFTTIVSNSGWVTDPNYEFCGLTSCQTYWYRVKSRTVLAYESDW